MEEKNPYNHHHVGILPHRQELVVMNICTEWLLNSVISGMFDPFCKNRKSIHSEMHVISVLGASNHCSIAAPCSVMKWLWPLEVQVDDFLRQVVLQQRHRFVSGLISGNYSFNDLWFPRYMYTTPWNKHDSCPWTLPITPPKSKWIIFQSHWKFQDCTFMAASFQGAM